MIKSPYNFVPISDKIFFPDWAEQVSHDVPFSDGESGTIKVKMTAKTPIYVRNGSKDKNETSFSKTQGKYFIPGTSVKGMIRSVMEIMSYGKMQQVDDRQFSWRDLAASDYTKNFTESINARPLVKSGFIIKVGDNWKLQPCEYARIEQCDLNAVIGVSKLSAKDKYDFWTKTELESLNQTFVISDLVGNKEKNDNEKQCGLHYRAMIDSSGDTEGQLVFTGQIGPRNRAGLGQHGKGKKHLEFVFFDEEDKLLEIPEKMRKDFELNHSDERNKEKHSNALSPNEEWGYWKSKLNNGEKMPVFWLEKDEIKVVNEKTEKQKCVASFGMAMLYRLPLENSVYDQIKCSTSSHVSHIENGKFIEDKFKADLLDCIFGYTVGKKALKGRVQFTHAFANGTPQVMQEKSEVLGSPKATFYPNYLEKGNYSSKNKIKGRKRYPVHKNLKSTINEAGNSNIETQFTPLAKDTEFECNINFHNLRKCEIGALLSALTFHNTSECFHSIGMAKSLGYGKIKLDTETNNLRFDKTEYLKEFEKALNIDLHKITDKKHYNRWAEGLTELVTMAREQSDAIENNLQYMPLADFVTAKNEGAILKYYSQQVDEDVKQINSFYSEEDLAEIFKENDKEIIEQKVAEEKAEKERIEKERIEVEEKIKAEKEANIKALENAQKEAEEKETNERLSGGICKALEKNNAGGVVSDTFKYFEVKNKKLTDKEQEAFIKRIKELNDKKLKKVKKKKKEWNNIQTMIGVSKTDQLKIDVGAK